MPVTDALTTALPLLLTLALTFLLTLTSGSGWGGEEYDGRGGGGGAVELAEAGGYPPEGAEGSELCDTARLQCTVRTGCGMALSNFFDGCRSVLTGEEEGGRCPTACQHALVSLLTTEDGAGRAFTHCDCRGEGSCQERKRRVQVCQRQVLRSMDLVRDRDATLSCSLARWICEADTSCLAALRYYVQHCAKLFAGTRCTSRCRNSVLILYRQPHADKLRTCRCEGDEDYDCPRLLNNTQRLCLQRHHRHHHHQHNHNHSHSHHREEFDDEGAAVYRQPGRPPAAPVSPQSHTSGQTSGPEARSAGPKAVHQRPFRRRQRRNKPGIRKRARKRPGVPNSDSALSQARRERGVPNWDSALSQARRERGVLKRRRAGFGREAQGRQTAGGRRCRGRKEGGRKKRRSGRRVRVGRRARLCRSKKASAKHRSALRLRKLRERMRIAERVKRSDASSRTRSQSQKEDW